MIDNHAMMFAFARPIPFRIWIIALVLVAAACAPAREPLTTGDASDSPTKAQEVFAAGFGVSS